MEHSDTYEFNQRVDGVVTRTGDFAARCFLQIQPERVRFERDIHSKPERVVDAVVQRQLGEGLWLGEFDLTENLGVSDSKVVVLKFDPKTYALKLLSASEQNNESMTGKE